MIGWLRSLIDRGEKAEREVVKQHMDHAVNKAQAELRKSQEARRRRMQLEVNARRRHS